MEKRRNDPAIAPTFFLWNAFVPNRYYFEVWEGGDCARLVGVYYRGWFSALLVPALQRQSCRLCNLTASEIVEVSAVSQIKLPRS